MSAEDCGRSSADLAQEELQAILSLDFERALALFKQKTEGEASTAEAEEAHYQAEAERLLQENEDAYNAQLERISKAFLDESGTYKDIWQRLSQSLVLRQREEAGDLEEKWRKARNIERRRKDETANVQLETARVLAMCQKFEEAIETRNAAQALKADDQTPELQAIDSDFSTRYRALIARHETEFQDLFQHLNSLIQALKDRAQGQRTVANAQLKTQNAANARMIIESVSRHAVSTVARDKVIQAFSPRTTQRYPPSQSGRFRSLQVSSNGSPF
jgi:hypothetical protein